MDNIFTLAIQHLTLAQTAELSVAHYDIRSHTIPCDEPDAEVSSVTEYDVGETIPSRQQ